ncbi:MAG: sigma-54-dependent Fis family transcriptional regulator [Deltaproteobacteria bacterium]|nr:MAG: sigma-54-dependent Fis family transcriptional regulator [Deltaproteobacteria bacterium]
MAAILVVDDNESVREGVATALHRSGHQVSIAADGPSGLAAWQAASPPFDVVITDLKMTPMDGMALLDAIHAEDPEAVVLFITGHGTVPAAVSAMREGAFDFLEKPFSAELLRARVEKALEVSRGRAQTARLARENEHLRAKAAPPSDNGVGRLIGDSAPMQRLRDLIVRVARTDSSVLVLGESGTGKELVASAIHAESPRAAGPFVTVNCGALADSLLESELFGHEKGAFTDAHSRRLGLFEMAHGGTLLLDEIGDVSPALQVRLLRVLQEGTFQRLGGERPIRVDVRVVAATHRDLEHEVGEGRFREDLFYRLNVVPLEVPPLRERPEDVALLAEHFLDRLRARTRSQVEGFTTEAMERLKAWPWKGNVRELENCVEHCLVFADGKRVDLGDLPAPIAGMDPGESMPVPSLDIPLNDALEQLERRLIMRAWERAGGVKTETARLLGIKPSALYYKLDKYGLGDRGPAGPGDDDSG